MKKIIMALVSIPLLYTAPVHAQDYNMKQQKIAQYVIDHADMKYPSVDSPLGVSLFTYNRDFVVGEDIMSVSVDDYNPDGINLPGDKKAGREDTIEIFVEKKEDGFVAHFWNKGLDSKVERGITLDYKDRVKFQRDYLRRIDELYNALFNNK